MAGIVAAAGTIGLYIAGERYEVTIRAGDDGAAVAAKIIETVNADPFAPVIASAGESGAAPGPDEVGSGNGDNSLPLAGTGGDSVEEAASRRARRVPPPPAPRAAAARAGGGAVTYTAKHKGAVGNEISRVLNFRGDAGGEATPPGITITGSNAQGHFAGGVGLLDLRPTNRSHGRRGI